MVELIAVGYWRDDHDESLPTPQSLVGAPYLPSVRDGICRYLDSGVRFMGWLGYSSCRFSCGIPDSQMGVRDLSDGRWVWPEGLSHYVRAHHVLLPEQFLRSMGDAGWRCPENQIHPRLVRGADGGSRLLPVDHELWKQWSASHAVEQGVGPDGRSPAAPARRSRP